MAPVFGSHAVASSAAAESRDGVLKGGGGHSSVSRPTDRGRVGSGQRVGKRESMLRSPNLGGADAPVRAAGASPRTTPRPVTLHFRQIRSLKGCTNLAGARRSAAPGWRAGKNPYDPIAFVYATLWADDPFRVATGWMVRRFRG